MRDGRLGDVSEGLGAEGIDVDGAPDLWGDAGAGAGGVGGAPVAPLNISSNEALGEGPPNRGAPERCEMGRMGVSSMIEVWWAWT